MEFVSGWLCARLCLWWPKRYFESTSRALILGCLDAMRFRTSARHSVDHPLIDVWMPRSGCAVVARSSARLTKHSIHQPRNGSPKLNMLFAVPSDPCATAPSTGRFTCLSHQFSPLSPGMATLIGRFGVCSFKQYISCCIRVSIPSSRYPARQSWVADFPAFLEHASLGEPSTRGMAASGKSSLSIHMPSIRCGWRWGHTSHVAFCS